MCDIFVRIKQNVRIIYTFKSVESMREHTIVWRTVVRIIEISYYPVSTVYLFNSFMTNVIYLIFILPFSLGDLTCCTFSSNMMRT